MLALFFMNPPSLKDVEYNGDFDGQQVLSFLASSLFFLLLLNNPNNYRSNKFSQALIVGKPIWFSKFGN